MVIFKATIDKKEHTLVGRVVCSNDRDSYCVSCPNYFHSAEIYTDKAVEFVLSRDEVTQGSALYIAAGPSTDTSFQRHDNTRFFLGTSVNVNYKFK
jgi:hypothetical protein